MAKMTERAKSATSRLHTGLGLGDGWRRERQAASLSEVHRSIPVREGGSSLRKALAFMGPGYLVAVGYMDPGNWATSLAGGAKFGYALLFVALLSNVMAILLQHLCARMAVATGRDLSSCQASAKTLTMRLPCLVTLAQAITSTGRAERR
jgi:manganese transport protein